MLSAWDIKGKEHHWYRHNGDSDCCPLSLPQSNTVYTMIQLMCKIIWRYRTYTWPVRCILSRAWMRLSIFSQFSIIQYVGLCVFSLPISLEMSERIYTLSYHHQIGSMNYYALLKGKVMKQWCALYVSPYSYDLSHITGIGGIWKLRFRMWETSFEHGAHSITHCLLPRRGYRNLSAPNIAIPGLGFGHTWYFDAVFG